MKCRFLNSPTKITIANMKEEQLGVTDDGRIYLRLRRSAVCLTDLGNSYTNNADTVELLVTILPPGTQLILEAE